RLGVPAGAGGVAIGSKFAAGQGPLLTVRSPIDGSTLGELGTAGPSEVDSAIDAGSRAFEAWRNVPAPRRGELVRRLAELLRAHQSDLALLVTLEVGKIEQEARGE